MLGKIFFIFLVFIVLFSIKNFTIFTENEIFSVKHIEFENVTKSVENDIMVNLDILKEKNIWDIEEENIKEILEKDIRIESVSIEKIMPNKLKINIKETEPSMYINYKNKLYLVDFNGNILGTANEYKGYDLIIGEVKNIEEIEDILSVLKNIEDDFLKNFISQIVYVKPYEIDLILKDGTKIKTLPIVVPKEYTVSTKLYLKIKNEQKNKKIEYIDIRFEDYIVKSGE